MGIEQTGRLALNTIALPPRRELSEVQQSMTQNLQEVNSLANFLTELTGSEVDYRPDVIQDESTYAVNFNFDLSNTRVETQEDGTALYITPGVYDPSWAEGKSALWVSEGDPNNPNDPVHPNYVFIVGNPASDHRALNLMP